MKKFWVNQYGNDRQRGKCTYVTKYGLNTAIEMLENEIKEAINILKQYQMEDDFLEQLALYIKNRNK